MAMLRTNRTVQRRDRCGDRPLLDRVFGGLVLASALLLVPYLVAGHSVADKWQVNHLEIADGNDSCRLRAASNAVPADVDADLSQCDGKFAAKWSAAERRRDCSLPSMPSSS